MYQRGPEPGGLTAAEVRQIFERLEYLNVTACQSVDTANAEGRQALFMSGMSASYRHVTDILRSYVPADIPEMSEDEAADVEPGWVCSWVTGSNWDPENTDNCDQDAEVVDQDGVKWCLQHAPDGEFTFLSAFTDPREIDETR